MKSFATLWLISLLLGIAGTAMAENAPRLTVQLRWLDQAQFAGFYVADKKGYFAEEGIEVQTLPGGPEHDNVAELQAGKVDVVVTTYAQALQNAASPAPIVNIAQLFTEPSLMLICQVGSGIEALQDVVGKTVAVGRPADHLVVDQMLKTVATHQPAVRYVDRGVSAEPLFDGMADCITGEVYNEYRQVIDARGGAEDFVVFRPKDFAVHSLEDGLYVLRSRLNNAEFVDQLARLLKGLRRGWEDARAHPRGAVDITLLKAPTLNRIEQASQLEAVNDLLPDKDLLFLDPAKAIAAKASSAAMPPWTHAVWNRMQELDGNPETFHRSTLYLAAQAEKSPWFIAVLMFGFCAFALAATIDSVNHGYDLWGRLVIALVSVMGGGILRDLILAPSRLPFSFLQDPSVPLTIVAVVIAYTLLLVVVPNVGSTALLRTIRRYSEAVGFGIISVYGAVVCVLAGTAWYWAPLAAAMTVAGGGIMRDIIVNREPRNFRGAIFEEVGVLAGLLVVAGLLVANRFEHSAWLVYAVLAFVVVFTAGLQFFIQLYQIRYPRWLAQPEPT